MLHRSIPSPAGRAPACKPVPLKRHGPWPAKSRSRPPAGFAPLAMLSPEGEGSVERNGVVVHFVIINWTSRACIRSKANAAQTFYPRQRTVRARRLSMHGALHGYATFCILFA